MPAQKLVLVDRYPFLQLQSEQQVSENNFTARDPMLSVTGIGFDSNCNSESQEFSRLSNIAMYSLYRKSEKICKTILPKI